MYTGGFPSPASDYASVTRPAGRGLGVLAQGSFLATHASLGHVVADQARAVRLLQAVLPAARWTPPPNVPPLDTTSAMTGINTTRDRYEKLHAQGRQPARGCHTAFDPIGFGFEHFDEGGRYRAKEKTFDINSARLVTAPDGTTITFTDEEDLMTGGRRTSRSSTSACRAYLAAFAFGSDEACLGASQVTALQSGSIGIAEAFARLATEPHFTQRSSQ